MATLTVVDRRPGSWQFGVAWIALSLALAAHVLDEAATGFIDLYNPTVQSLRGRFGWFPMPVFTFDVWLGGLFALMNAESRSASSVA